MTLVKFLGFSNSTDTVENPIPSTSCIIEMRTISIIYFWGKVWYFSNEAVSHSVVLCGTYKGN